METSSPPTLSLWSQFWKERAGGVGARMAAQPRALGTARPDRGPASFFGREAWHGHVRGLRESNPRSVHSAGVSRPRVARGLPQMRRVQPVPGRDVHVLRERREDLLQAGLCQVSPGPGGWKVEKVGKGEKAARPLAGSRNPWAEQGRRPRACRGSLGASGRGAGGLGEARPS